MIQELQIRVVPEVAGEYETLKTFLSKTLKIEIQEIRHIEILSRSIDARQKNDLLQSENFGFYRRGLCRKTDCSS